MGEHLECSAQSCTLAPQISSGNIDYCFNIYNSLELISLHLIGHLKLAKGQLISKANCQVLDSPNKQTNEFAFFLTRRVVI